MEKDEESNNNNNNDRNKKLKLEKKQKGTSASIPSGMKICSSPHSDFNILKSRTLCHVLRRLCHSTCKTKRVMKILHKVLLVLDGLLVVMSKQSKTTRIEMIGIIERALNEIEMTIYDACTVSLPIYFIDPDDRNQRIYEWMQYIEQSCKAFMKESPRRQELLSRWSELIQEILICRSEEHEECMKLTHNVFATNLSVAKLVCEETRIEIRGKLTNISKQKRLLRREDLTDEAKRQIYQLEKTEDRYRGFLKLISYSDPDQLLQSKRIPKNVKKRDRTTTVDHSVEDDEGDNQLTNEPKKLKSADNIKNISTTMDTTETELKNKHVSQSDDDVITGTEKSDEAGVSTSSTKDEDKLNDSTEETSEKEPIQKNPKTKLPISIYDTLFSYIKSPDEMKMYLACMSFRAIASFTPKEADYMVHNGSLECVIKVMESATSFRVQEQAVAALCSMTVARRNRQKLMKLGKHQTLTQMVEKVHDSKEMEEALRGFIWDVDAFEQNCSSDNEEEVHISITATESLSQRIQENSSLDSRKGYFSDQIFNSIDFTDEPGSYLACMGFRFITHFSLEERNYIVSNNGISLLVNLIQFFNNSFRIKEQAIAALCNIARDKSNRIDLVNANVPRIVTDAMEQRNDSTSLQLVGCGLLKNISNDLNDALTIANSLVQSDTILSMIDAIENCKESEVLVKFACDALSNIAKYRESDRLLINKLGGKNILNQIKGEKLISKEYEQKINSTLKIFDKRAPKTVDMHGKRRPPINSNPNRKNTTKKATTGGNEATKIAPEENPDSNTNNMSSPEKKELEDSKINLDSNNETETVTRVHLDSFGT